jgi:hypothetical protein
MKKILFLLLCLFVLMNQAYTQADTSSLKFSSSWFANIFTAFYYSPTGEAVPPKGFEFSTGLIGYKGQWGNRASATLIYDVFRTTDQIQVADSNNTPLNVSYFRGSDYTGFLKMAQIDFRINPMFELSVGQLLNQQYLTYQDKFWGFRYIATTFQELYRFGSPADFGARITAKPHKSLAVTLGAVNGNGPFRMQSSDGDLQYFTNIEWVPATGLILKLFADHAPTDETPSRNALSLFAGYRCDAWRLGLEVNHVANHLNLEENDFSGTSLYGAVKVAQGWHLLARHDYIVKSSNLENEHYLIGGVEYEPYKGFYTSLNGRFLTKGNTAWIYASFGAKF